MKLALNFFDLMKLKTLLFDSTLYDGIFRKNKIGLKDLLLSCIYVVHRVFEK